MVPAVVVTVCKVGRQLKVGARGKVCVYPNIETDPTGPIRTNNQILDYSKQVVCTKEPVFGVKGPSWQSSIPNYNVIQGNIRYRSSVTSHSLA